MTDATAIDTYAPDDDPAAYGIDLSTMNIMYANVWAKQQAFLAALGTTGRIMASARAAGVHVMTVYYWKDNNVLELPVRLEKAQAAWRENLEKIALDRILDPQGNRGSDVLLMSQLNAAWPEKYRPNVVVQDTNPQKQILAEILALAKKGKRVKARLESEIEVEQE